MNMCSITQTSLFILLDGEKTQSNWKSTRRLSTDSTDSGFSSTSSPQLRRKDFLEMPLPDNFPPTMPEYNQFNGHPAKNLNTFILPPPSIARTDSGYGSFHEDNHIEDNKCHDAAIQNSNLSLSYSQSDSISCDSTSQSFSSSSSSYKDDKDTAITEAAISFDKLPILERQSPTSLLTTQFQNITHSDILPTRFRTAPSISTDDLDNITQGRNMHEEDGDEKDDVLWGFFPTKIVCKDHWVADEDSKMCSFCHMPFTLLRRRHHCRICGLIFCRICCSGFACLSPTTLKPSPLGGYPVRICISCHVDSSQPPENWDHHGVKVFVVEMGWKLMGMVSKLFGFTMD